MIIISTFKDPALRIAQHWRSMHYPVEATDLHKQTLNQSRALVILLSENLCCVIMVFVTSILAPLLLLVAVPWSWMNLCSLAWVAESERAAFGPSIAQHVIVHAPLRVFRAMSHTGNALVSIFVFVDLQVHSPFIIESYSEVCFMCSSIGVRFCSISSLDYSACWCHGPTSY